MNIEPGATFVCCGRDYLYVRNNLGAEQHLIINVTNADVEFTTSDYAEFCKMWEEMSA